MTRAWGERYRAEVWEAKACEIAKDHFSMPGSYFYRPGHRWVNPPDDYDEWLRRYKEEERLDHWAHWHFLIWNLKYDMDRTCSPRSDSSESWSIYPSIPATL